MSKRIPLSPGELFTVVDDEWYDELSAFSWYAQYNPCTKTYYAVRRFRVDGVYRAEYMHRRITRFVWRIVDHANHDTLDNQITNLRDGTGTNQRNGRRRGGSSIYHGVSWDSDRGKWKAQIKVDYRNTLLGRFDDEIEAARAYDRASLELHGEYGTRNFDSKGAPCNPPASAVPART